MPNETTQKVNLSQTYIYNGKRYGPGEAEVPEKAVESLRKKEAAHQEYLRTHEAPAPVTPALVSGERHDFRSKPAAPQAAAPRTPDTRPQSQTFTAATGPATSPASTAKTAVAATGDADGPNANRAAAAAKGAKHDADDEAKAHRGHR